MLGFLFAVNLNHTQAEDLADTGPYLMLNFVCPLLFCQFKRIVPIHVHVLKQDFFYFFFVNHHLMFRGCHNLGIICHNLG